MKVPSKSVEMYWADTQKGLMLRLWNFLCFTLCVHAVYSYLSVESYNASLGFDFVAKKPAMAVTKSYN